jgi:hypothetical protein
MKLAIIAASLILIGSAQAQTATEKYDLEQRCGRRAAETFAKDWEGGTPGIRKGNTTANYENHYNSRLNKCFYLEMITQ